MKYIYAYVMIHSINIRKKHSFLTCEYTNTQINNTDLYKQTHAMD